MTTVKELIEKLSKCDPDLPVIFEPNIDCMDSEICGSWVAMKFFDDEKQDDIFIYTSFAQKYNYSYNNTEYLFDEWLPDGSGLYDNSLFEKKCLILSGPQFKYGAKEDNIK